jgi:phage tail-like protein
VTESVLPLAASALSGSAYSIAGGLPSVQQRDDFLSRLVSGFDDALASLVICLDNLDAYLDPGTAPLSWVSWLADWVSVGLDETWTPQRQRRMLAAAGEVMLWRGTARGVAAALSAYAGAPVQVEDSGAITTSRAPAASVVVVTPATVTVRIGTVGEPISAETVDRLVAHLKPAHVRHVLVLAE